MIKVFISYSHDNEDHQQQVYALADRLIGDGVQVVLDRDCIGGPDEGWDKWSEMQAEKSVIVLPVFTPEYRRCWDGGQIPNMRLGAIHELKVIYRRLYEAGSHIDFCRIVTFDDDHRNSIPTFLKGLQAFDAQRDYAAMLDWLRAKGAVQSESINIQLNWPVIPVTFNWPLADRKEPFEVFKGMIEQQIPQRIFLIEGVSNTGKTVLVNELFELAKSIELPAVLLDLKGCPNLSELFDLLTLDINARVLPSFHSAVGWGKLCEPQRLSIIP